MSRKITANSFHHCTKKLLNRNHINTWLVGRIQICGIIIYTNTLEGFWSIDKNGIRGAFNVLCKKYLPFYPSEFTYKYNHPHK